MITFKLEGSYNNKLLSLKNMGADFLRDVMSHLPGKLISEKASLSIEEGSACLKMTEEQLNEDQQTLVEITSPSSNPLSEAKVIENIENVDNKLKFDPRCNAELKKLQKTLKKYRSNCIIFSTQPPHNESTKLTLSQDTSILTDEDLWHPTQKYIYGEILEIGGKSPNIHVEDETAKKIIIDIDKKDIQKIEKNILYQKRCIYVSCEEHELSKEIRKCHFISWDDYGPDYVRDNFEAYQKQREEAFKKSWDFENIKENYGGDNDKWLEDIRYGE